MSPSAHVADRDGAAATSSSAASARSNVDLPDPGRTDEGDAATRRDDQRRVAHERLALLDDRDVLETHVESSARRRSPRVAATSSSSRPFGTGAHLDRGVEARRARR